jgi:hypothetical protein
MVAVEGDYGPRCVIPPFLATWLRVAFPLPDGHPAARNILDARSKKQGKSTLAAGVALYMATRQKYAEVVIVASDLQQSKDRVFRACRYAIEHGPLVGHARCFKDVIELNNRSLITAIPADWQGAAGGNFYAVIFDELHAWVYETQRRLFDEMIIPPTQPHGVRWMSSYAGWLGESNLLKEWWDRGLAGAKMSDDLPIFYAEPASLLAFVDTGPDSWRMPWMSDKYIQEIKTSERPNTFRRIWLNEWVSNESQFLPEGAWEACYSPDVTPLAADDKRRVVLGADASTSRDLTALVGVLPGKRREVVFCRVWKPKKGTLRHGKPTVDLEETIGAEVLRMHKARQVLAVVCDPYQLHTSVIAWEKAGIKVIELAQNAGRVEADQALYDTVISRQIAHYNEPGLNEHMRNAIAVETLRGYRLAKDKTSMKIDAAVALSMASWGAAGMGGYQPMPSSNLETTPSLWRGGGVSGGNTDLFGEDANYQQREHNYQRPPVGGTFGKKWDNND